MSKNKAKNNTSRRKKMKRNARLASAKQWLQTYSGKHILQSYCKHYAVDKICGIKELRLLDVQISPEYENKIRQSVESFQKARKLKKEKREKELSELFDEFSDENFAFIAGYTSNGVPYGITHEEMKLLEEEKEG